MIGKLLKSYKVKSLLFLIKSFFGLISFKFTKKANDLEGPIVLVFAANDSYAMMLSATIKSLILNHKSENDLVIYVIDDNVSIENKAIIENVVGNDASLNWIIIDDAFLSKFNVYESYRNLTPHYWRLLIPYFVPEDVKKVIYLDSDLIVLRDIYNLWCLPFDGNVIMAVQDTRFPLIKDSIRNYHELGMDGNAKYFNSGVLLIDLQKWREMNVSAEVINCVEKNWDVMLFDDQYGLNVILYKKWKCLNPNWNLFPEFFPSNPYILHYISVKPTSLHYANYHQNIFYDYLDLTPWKGWRP